MFRKRTSPAHTPPTSRPARQRSSRALSTVRSALCTSALVNVLACWKKVRGGPGGAETDGAGQWRHFLVAPCLRPKVRRCRRQHHGRHSEVSSSHTRVSPSVTPVPKKYHGTYSQARVPPGLKGQTPRRSVRPNARAAGPRRPAEAGPWGAAKERRALWLNLARGRAKVWHRNDQNGSHVFHLVVPTSGATMKTPGAWGPLPSVCKWDYCSLFFVVGGRLASL